jgi:hypothetical protein
VVVVTEGEVAVVVLFPPPHPVNTATKMASMKNKTGWCKFRDPRIIPPGMSK